MMNAAIISLGSISSQMVGRALQKYFEQVEMIELKDVEVDLGKEPGIYYHEQILPHFDCVYAKGSFRYANLLRSITTLLEGKVWYMPLPAHSFTTVHNKLLTHLILQQQNIPMPATYLAPNINAAKRLLEKVHFPLVMKFPEGTQGKGVMFADSKSSAYSLLDALGALNQPFIIQEYIETGGTDIRALVVGNRVIAAMKRKAQSEDKRANIHAGGIGEPVTLSKEIQKLAIATAKALGTDICGVDILESPFGPKVIEANISPGLQELSKVTSVDIADEIAQFLYNKTIQSLEEKNNSAVSKVVHEATTQETSEQEVIATLQFRGERILLPELVTRLTQFKDQQEYILSLKKGKLEIKEL